MPRPSQINPWKHIQKFIPGTLVRADSMNEKLDGVAQTLEALVMALQQNLITTPDTLQGSTEIPERTIEDAFLHFTLAGDADIMPYPQLEQRLRLSPRIMMAPITEDYTLDYAFADQRYFTVDSPDEVQFRVSTAASTTIEGAVIYINRYGDGDVNIVALDGVTINSAATSLLRAKHSTAMLVYRGNNEWDLAGDLVQVA